MPGSNQNMSQPQMQQQQMGGMGGNMMQQQQQQQQQQQMMQNQRYRSINLQQHPGNNFGGGMPNQQFQPGMGQTGVPGPYRQQNMNQMQNMRGPGMGGPMGGPPTMLLSQVRSPPPMGGPVQSPNPGQSPRGPMGGMVASPHTPPHQFQGNMQGMQVQGGGEQGDVNGSGHNVMMNNVMPNIDMGMGGGPSGPGNGPPDHSNSQSMTPQDQLSEFVKTL